MANGCSSCGSSSGCSCSAASTFTSVSSVASSLVTSLSGAVDALRDLQTRLGVRQYSVSLIWTRWTGGERGMGEEYVYREVELLPTPLVEDLTALSKEVASAGLVEMGRVRVSELSPRLDEGSLLGLIDSRLPPPDTNFYWEVMSPPREDATTIRRRFFPVSPPALNPTRFEWVIQLVRAQGDRTPCGLPRFDPQGLNRSRVP